MLFEFIGKCQHCNEAVEILVHNGLPIENCRSCGKVPFTLRPFKGLVYCLYNINQTGVKIGMTEKSVEARVKQLNTTGVPGKFDIVVIFHSDKPRADEKKVQEKLKKYRLAKEHFDLDPITAAVKCYNILGKRRPIFYDKKLEEKFNLQLAKNKAEMALKLHGK